MTVPALSGTRLTWTSFEESATSFVATGDWATETIQNASGDDAIFLTGEGSYLLLAGINCTTVPTPEAVNVSWDASRIPIRPFLGSMNTPGTTQPRRYSVVGSYAVAAYNDGGPPRSTALRIDNNAAGATDWAAWFAIVMFWPGKVPEMQTVY